MLIRFFTPLYFALLTLSISAMQELPIRLFNNKTNIAHVEFQLQQMPTVKFYEMKPRDTMNITIVPSDTIRIDGSANIVPNIIDEVRNKNLKSLEVELIEPIQKAAAVAEKLQFKINPITPAAFSTAPAAKIAEFPAARAATMSPAEMAAMAARGKVSPATISQPTVAASNIFPWLFDTSQFSPLSMRGGLPAFYLLFREASNVLLALYQHQNFDIGRLNVAYENLKREAQVEGTSVFSTQEQSFLERFVTGLNYYANLRSTLQDIKSGIGLKLEALIPALKSEYSDLNKLILAILQIPSEEMVQSMLPKAYENAKSQLKAKLVFDPSLAQELNEGLRLIDMAHFIANEFLDPSSEISVKFPLIAQAIHRLSGGR